MEQTEISAAKNAVAFVFSRLESLEHENKRQHIHILALREKIQALTGKPWFNSFDALTLQKIAPR